MNKFLQKFNGYICRTWTETTENGWCSSFERFDTEEESYEYGYIHTKNIIYDELSREFEVYCDY